MSFILESYKETALQTDIYYLDNNNVNADIIRQFFRATEMLSKSHKKMKNSHDIFVVDS